MNSNNEKYYIMNSALYEAKRDRDDYKNQMNEMMKAIGNLREQN